MGRSQYGTLEPTIEIRFPAACRYRTRTAALQAFVAEIEAATSPGDTWCVELADGNYEMGRVWLELANGTPEEARRGLALLRKVVA